MVLLHLYFRVVDWPTLCPFLKRRYSIFFPSCCNVFFIWSFVPTTFQHKLTPLSTGTDHEFQICWFITVYCVVYVNDGHLDSRQPREWMAAVKYARGWFLNLITAVLCCQQNKIIHQSANWCDFNTTQTHTTLLHKSKISSPQGWPPVWADARASQPADGAETSKIKSFIKNTFWEQNTHTTIQIRNINSNINTNQTLHFNI